MLNFNENVLPYISFYSGSTYSTAYNSYNVCDRSKLFAVLKLPVDCLLGSWYFHLKCIISSQNETKNIQ